MTLLNILLIIHLAGLIMGFVGGRTHGEVVNRLRTAGPEATKMLWELEKKSSWTAFIGTGLLIVSGALLLWLKYNGLEGQSLLFWLKIALVVVVTWAEIARHFAALRWRDGDETQAYWAAAWGKISGISAVAVVIVAVFNFNN
jgi:uncharacterized membrane protein